MAANATGSLTLQVQNPSPGGTTTTFAEPIEANSIALTATDADGTNTGTAELGVNVTMSAVVTGSAQTPVTWSVSGGGSITAKGVYTAPAVMPAGAPVTITAALTSNPAITASYQLSLINPMPVVSGATPGQLLTGGTQTVTLVGSGFVPGTTVMFNGASLPIAYTGYNNATVQVPVAANATGTLTLQVQNPSPGGGAGTTFSEIVAPNSISLTASDADGTNTGTAELGVNVTMTAAVTGSAQTAVTWSVAGAGSISASGVYSAPATMPATNAVTITAALTSNPSVTASYQFNIINPHPIISGTSPLLTPAGATTAVTLSGTGFVPGTVILVNNNAVTSTYQSATSVVAEITVAAGATGNLSLQAESPSPGGGAIFYELAIDAPIGATAAARLLDQTTFGPTTSLIQHVQQEGVTAWLAEQFNTPATIFRPCPKAAFPHIAATRPIAPSPRGGRHSHR